MKTMIIRSLLIICGIFIPQVLFAEEPVNIGGIFYNLNPATKEATVTYRDNNYNSYSGSVEIPDRISVEDEVYAVTGIGAYAFQSCSDLTTVKLGNSVTSIGIYAFFNCPSLTSVELPAVTKIDRFAFQMCENIMSVRIGSLEQWCSVEFGGDYACPMQFGLFRSVDLYIGDAATRATEITIPENVANIGPMAFCNTTIERVSAPGVKSVGKLAFNMCKNLTSVDLPAAEYIDQGAFQQCTALATVSLQSVSTSVWQPESTKGIGNRAFYSCHSLKSVTIPDVAELVGDNAFYSCGKLATIYCYAKKVPQTGGDVFSGVSLKDVVLYVPEVALADYRSAEKWGEIGNILPLTLDDPTVEPSDDPTVEPSDDPTVEPSDDPTVEPSDDPTVEPSDDPTVEPSDDPTVEPSDDPTVEPSDDPTVEPSDDPTVEPSDDPTVEPSDEPTAEPLGTVETPVVTYGNGYIVMDCETEGASIYYTLDGSEPSLSGVLYTEPVGTVKPCTVRAVARMEDWNDSDVVTFELKKATAPEIFYSFGGWVYMEWMRNMPSGTPLGVQSVRYTLDGSDPTEVSAVYSGRFEVRNNCTVKARGYVENMIPSEVAVYRVRDFKVAMPVISFANEPTSEPLGTVAITCKTEGARIYYTLDGSDPRMDGTLYTAAVTIEKNCTVRACGKRDMFEDSEVAMLQVDSPDFKCSAPVIALRGGLLSIGCATEDESVRYTLDGSEPTEGSDIYTSPIRLTRNCTIKARAFAENLYPSDVASYTVSSLRCAAPMIDYDGRRITLNAESLIQNPELATAVIYYTLDGSVPTRASAMYDGPFDVMGLRTVRAIVTSEGLNDSEMTSYTVTSYYDGNRVSIGKAGTIAVAFGWCEKDTVERLTVSGVVDVEDIGYISAMASLRHLNMEDAVIDGDTLVSRAFADSRLVSVWLPERLGGVGSDLFAGCNELAAIVWNANMNLAASALNGVDNPNLLLYVRRNSYAPSMVRNVVVDGVAEDIELKDGEGNANFYVPLTFTAKSIAYRHNYSQKTVIGKCAGWETIALPFDVQRITHSKNGAIAPFAKNAQNAKPFWLYALGDSGFSAATEIKADTPYIISMPNNEEYADEYILGGDVTFCAEDVTMQTPSDFPTGEGEEPARGGESQYGGFRFVPTMMRVEQGANVYAINKGVDNGVQLPGSRFESDLRSISPFEAYLTMYAHQANIGNIPLNYIGFEGEATGISIPTKSDGINVRGGKGTLIISSDVARKLIIYNVSGIAVREVDLAAGKNIVVNLPSGVYIVGNKKVGVF